jgi:hypothetical protein
MMLLTAETRSFRNSHLKYGILRLDLTDENILRI